MKIYFYTAAISAAIISFFVINQKAEKKLTQKTDKTYISSPMENGSPDDPNSRVAWDIMRLADTETGKIPKNIRQKELAFSRNLPINQNRNINWQSHGPENRGGRTRAVAYDVLDTNIMLAGGVTGGIWRSENGGQNWTKMTDPSQIHSVTSIVQDARPGKENTWYAGTGEYYGVVSATSFSSQFSGNGVFKSTDNGQTWNLLSSTVSNTPQTNLSGGDFDCVWRLVTDHTNTTDDVVLAAVYGGIMRSTDGGTSWTAVHGMSGSNSSYGDLIQTPNGIFYAAFSNGTAKGIYRSSDGITWTQIFNNNFPSNYNRSVLAYNPSDENEIWIFTHTPGAGHLDHQLFKYTYLSGDGSGANGTWEDKSINLPNYSCTGYFDFDFGPINSQSSYNMCITVHPNDGNTIFIGGTNIYRSTNGFSDTTQTSWIGGYYCHPTDPSKYVALNHHPDQHYMIFHPGNPNRMISASDGGLSYTEDCTSPIVDWELLNTGYITSQFYTVAIEAGETNSNVIIGGMQDNGTWYTNSSVGSDPWKEIGIDDGAYCAIAQNEDFYLISSQRGRLYKKDIDVNGNILNTQRIDPTGNENAYLFINPFIMDPNNSDVMYLGGSSKLWRNSDLGSINMTGDIYNNVSTNWNQIQQSAISSSLKIVCLDMCASSPETVFYGTNNAKVYRLDSANSATPIQTNITGSNFPSTGYTSSIAVNPIDKNEIIVTFSNYNKKSIFYTNDGGQNWQDIGGNLEENTDGTGTGPAVYWAEIYPGGNYFVGTSIGLFSGTPNDTNTVWTMEGANEIGNVIINMITSRPYDGKIVVGTHGNGVFSANLSPLGNSENENSISNFKVYPNPSNGNINIDLNGIKSSTIHIYDLNGKLVKSLPNSFSNTIEVNNLVSGIYFIKIGNETKKVIVK